MNAPVAHSFILETLLDSKLADRIRVKPMFGSHAVYIDDKIVFILRHRENGFRNHLRASKKMLSHFAIS